MSKAAIRRAARLLAYCQLDRDRVLYTLENTDLSEAEAEAVADEVMQIAYGILGQLEAGDGNPQRLVNYAKNPAAARLA